ncbi:hypothetical protein ABIE76_003324 [Sinorhizobium fredii]
MMCKIAFFMQERIENKKECVNPCSALREHLGETSNQGAGHLQRKLPFTFRMSTVDPVVKTRYFS